MYYSNRMNRYSRKKAHHLQHESVHTQTHARTHTLAESWVFSPKYHNIFQIT